MASVLLYDTARVDAKGELPFEIGIEFFGQFRFSTFKFLFLRYVQAVMTNYILFLAVILPAAFWILFSLTTRRFAVWYRALSTIYAGLMGGALSLIHVAAAVSGNPAAGLRQDGRIFLLSLLMAGLVMIVMALLLSGKPFPEKVSWPVAAVSSLASAGMQFICVSAVILFAGIVKDGLLKAGNEAAAREIQGTGVSAKVVYIFYAFMLPLGMILMGVVSLLKGKRIRDRQAEKLARPNPPRLHIAYVLLALCLLAAFINLASEIGLVR